MCVKIAKGNDGSQRVCEELLSKYHQHFLWFDNIHKISHHQGHELWYLYKEICGEDMDITSRTLDAIRDEGIGFSEVWRALHTGDKQGLLKDLVESVSEAARVERYWTEGW